MADHQGENPLIWLVALDQDTGVTVRRAEALAGYFRSHLGDECRVDAVTGRRWRALAALVLRLRRAHPRFLYVLNTGIGGLPLVLVAHMLGIPVIVDTGDDSTELARAMGRRWWQVGTIALAEMGMLRAAAQVVVRSTRLHERMRHRVRAGTPILIIPDGVYQTPASRYQEPTNALFTIGVLGSLHWSRPLRWGYGLETIEVVARCRRRGIVCQGLIFGDGPAMAHLQSMAVLLGVADAVRFLGHLAYDTVQRHLSLCDVFLLVAPPHEAFRVRVTGKFAEYAVTGKPILASNTGEWAKFLPPDFVVDWSPGDAEAFYTRLSARTEQLIRGELEPFHLRAYDPIQDFSQAVMAAMRTFEVLGQS